MAYKPFLIDVSFDDDTSTITLTIEHRDDTSLAIIKRVYIATSGQTANQIKNIIKAKNDALNTRPAIISTIQALIGQEIT